MAMNSAERVITKSGHVQMKSDTLYHNNDARVKGKLSDYGPILSQTAFLAAFLVDYQPVETEGNHYRGLVLGK